MPAVTGPHLCLGKGRERIAIKWTRIIYARSQANCDAAMALHHDDGRVAQCNASLDHQWVGSVDGLVVRLPMCTYIINCDFLTEWEETHSGVVHLRFSDSATLSFHPETVSDDMLAALPLEMKRFTVLPSSD